MNCVLQLVGVDQGDANCPELVTTSDDVMIKANISDGQ